MLTEFSNQLADAAEAAAPSVTSVVDTVWMNGPGSKDLLETRG